VSRWIVDASLSLGWYLKDEQDRSIPVDLRSPNGLVTAHRRNRITIEDLTEIMESLKALPILFDPADSELSSIS